MKNTANKNNEDKRIEIYLAGLLRAGVIVAGIVVMMGACLFLLRHGTENPGYHIFNASTFNLSDFSNLFHGIITFRSFSIMELGILMLIATPIIRVLFSIIAFTYEKDYLYVVFTVIVLLILLSNVFY